MSNFTGTIKKDDLFLSRNKRVKRMRELFSHSMKYIIEVGSSRRRNKINGHSNPFSYYGLYIGAYVETHKIYFPDNDENTHSPEAFLFLMSATEFDDYMPEKIEAAIHELLFLSSKVTKKEMFSLNEYFIGLDSIDANLTVKYDEFVMSKMKEFGLESFDDAFLSSEDDFKILSELQ